MVIAYFQRYFSYTRPLAVIKNSLETKMKKENIEPKYFWIYINPPHGAKNSEWNNIGADLENFCYDFTCLYDFGESMISTNFNFYIEKEVEMFKQDDMVSTSTYLGIPKQTRLNIHINYEKFEKSDLESKFQILSNGILQLLNFWKSNLKIPKDINLDKIIVEYKNYLKVQEKYCDFGETNNIYVKANNLFRISFQNHLLKDIEKSEILIDIEEIENYLNDKMNNTTFGNSIKQLYFSYDIFDFYSPKTAEYKDDEKKYQFGKDNDLSIMEQFDTNFILYQSKSAQLEYFKDGILNAILRIKEMKRKPKDLDIEKLHLKFMKLLNEYIITTANTVYKTYTKNLYH